MRLLLASQDADGEQGIDDFETILQYIPLKL